MHARLIYAILFVSETIFDCDLDVQTGQPIEFLDVLDE